MAVHRGLGGEVIASGLRFPEGPVALADGRVLFVEIEAGTLSIVGREGGKDVVAVLGGGPNGAAIGPDGHCYVCNNGGFSWHTQDGFTRPVGPPEDFRGGAIQKVDMATGRVEVLYTHCDGRALVGPNDIVFDNAGGFWFSDFGKRMEDRMLLGGLYYAKADGTLIRQVARPPLTANGIGLSPDGTTLYVAETETSRLWRYPVLGPGEPGVEPWPSPNGGVLVYGAAGYQRFDSLAMEANGNICVATLVNGGISVISPEGELLEFHVAPEPYCTNLCFGGEDMRTAYVTLSGRGQLVAVPWAREGLRLLHQS